jgi:hypothetical protein
MTDARREKAIFVSRIELAARFDVSTDTIDQWVHDGYLPTAHMMRGQIRRWHWPTIEACFTTSPGDAANDPYMTGVGHAKGHARNAS